MGIIEEITIAIKDKVQQILPEFSNLEYEYDIESNNERSYTKRFGVIPKGSNIADGSTIGFITAEQEFSILLTDDFTNHDSDEAQRSKTFELFDYMHTILKNLHQKKLSSTNEYQILLVNGILIDDPEFQYDNGTIVLRMNISVQYKFRNKC